MQISKTNINNNHPKFKANYFTVEKIGQGYSLSKISTDNEENLGKVPILSDNGYEFPMTYDGKYYTTRVYPQVEKYRIFYKDTEKYEKNGKLQVINPLEFVRIAAKEDRKINNLPTELAYTKGSAKGKIIIAKTFGENRDIDIESIPKNIPVILLVDNIQQYSVHQLTDLPENVKGVITSSCEFCQLREYEKLYRNNLSVMSVILDKNKFEKLQNFDGKYLYINNENGLLQYQEKYMEESTKENIISKSIIPPKLDNVEKLLTYDELTTKNCGNKGYRLALMQKLVSYGKLKDISVPRFFVIPNGYINKVKKYINVEDEEEQGNRLHEGIFSKDVDKKIEEMGMDKRSLIIRSNYNTQDLGSFPSAKIYNSHIDLNGRILETAIKDIIEQSSDSKYTQSVHKKYGITKEQIQPSVIVQDNISPKYKFTFYTDDGKNNAIIEFTNDFGFMASCNALIKYNKKTKEFTIEHKESPTAEYLIDENGKILEQKQDESPIAKDWELLKPFLGIITSGALVLEKFFKHPQDIEGGIKDGKVYFWQTRDIIAKAVKRI